MITLEPKEYFSVLIPDGESPFALDVLKCLSQIKNVRTYVLSNDVWAQSRFSRYSTQFFSYSKANGNEGQLAAIYDTIKKTKVDVVLPVDEHTIHLLSRHSEILSELTSIAPLPKTDVFETALNKWLLAEWLKKNHFPYPPTILYQTNNNFDKSLSCISFPVLIKPILGGNGEGIKLFENKATLYSFCKEHISSEKYIIQSFIRGYDIDCSVLCQQGKILAYTIQKGFINGPSRFSPPSGIDMLYDRNVSDLVAKVVDKFNWTGVAHFDLRYDEQDKQIKVIEMNPRFWGSVLGSLSAGVNFPYLACLTGLKRDLPNIVFQPKRFVKGKIALKILALRMRQRNRRDIYFDDSPIPFLLKDPLPKVIELYSKFHHKVFHKRQRQT